MLMTKYLLLFLSKKLNKKLYENFNVIPRPKIERVIHYIKS